MSSKYSLRKRDRAYMAWIKTLPCANCTMSYRVAAASDLEPIPLCAACRRELRQVGTNFWSAFGLDRTALIKRYNRLYEELHPKISVKAAKEAAHK